MTITIHNVLATGRVEKAVFENEVVGRMYSLDVLAHSNRELCEESLIEAHFCLFTENEERLAGRFAVMSHKHDYMKGIHQYLFRSVGEIEVPDDFPFRATVTYYSREGTKWATT